MGGERPAEVSDVINLNWRNKTDRYTRISFSDLLKAPQGDPSLALMKDAYVVLGVSAPGLGMTKPTAVRAMEDDNEILATALDDVLSDTHLRVMPSWLVFLIEIVTVWALVWLGIGRSLGTTINKAFLALQGGAATITLLSASYTSYLVDLSTCMAFGAGLFGIIKLVNSLDAGWSRARPGLRAAVDTRGSGDLLLIGYRDSDVDLASAKELQRALEQMVGLSRVIRVDDLFGGESFARSMCEDYSCQICLVSDEHKLAVFSALEALRFRSVLEIREFDLEVDWSPDSLDFRSFLAPKLLRQCADFIDEQRSGG